MLKKFVKLLKLHQELEIDEVLEITAINRLRDIKEIANDSIINNKIIQNFSNMTQAQALTKLFQKQINDPSNSQNQPLLKPLTQIVSEVRNAVDAIDNLADLEKAVRDFEACALKKMATNTVFCDGNPKSEVMIIGEAPGNNEDLRGIPFCGESGKLLDDMFSYIGLTRANNFYITNVLFWRPPGNRRPTPDELAMCTPYVEKHIQLIAPKLIVLMGATAMSAVLGNDEPISKVRGKFLNYNNQYLKTPIATMCLFHPSYLLRQPDKKRLAWQDLLAIEKFLEKK